MRDLVLFAHIILGLALIAFPIIILLYLKKQPNWLKPLAFITAAISWILLLPAGKLYLTFYPATKTLINAGAWPWAHSIVMETKEHWGILLPIIASVAAGLVFSGKFEESKKWWRLTIVLSALLGVTGRHCSRSLRTFQEPAQISFQPSLDWKSGNHNYRIFNVWVFIKKQSFAWKHLRRETGMVQHAWQLNGDLSVFHNRVF